MRKIAASGAVELVAQGRLDDKWLLAQYMARLVRDLAAQKQDDGRARLWDIHSHIERIENVVLMHSENVRTIGRDRQE